MGHFIYRPSPDCCTTGLGATKASRSISPTPSGRMLSASICGSTVTQGQGWCLRIVTVDFGWPGNPSTDSCLTDQSFWGRMKTDSFFPTVIFRIRSTLCSTPMDCRGESSSTAFPIWTSFQGCRNLSCPTIDSEGLIQQLVGLGKKRLKRSLPGCAVFMLPTFFPRSFGRRV